MDDVSLPVQWPESAAEQVRWIVLLLKLNESIPVLAKTCFRFFWALATTEELNGKMSGCSLEWKGKREAHTLGRGPPCTTGFNVLSNHWQRAKSVAKLKREVPELATYILSGVHTLRIINPEIPLV